MNPYNIIIRAIDTEKTRYLAELGKYTFEVAGSANKHQVKRAIEEIFEVGVERVNVINVPAKIGKSRGRRGTGRQPGWKKAVVSLGAGQRLDVFEGA